MKLITKIRELINGKRAADEPIKAQQSTYHSGRTHQGTDAFCDLLEEADRIVRGKVVFKRFIEGTPLENDIAVWMANFALDYACGMAAAESVGPRKVTTQMMDVRRKEDKPRIDILPYEPFDTADPTRQASYVHQDLIRQAAIAAVEQECHRPAPAPSKGRNDSCDSRDYSSPSDSSASPSSFSD